MYLLNIVKIYSYKIKMGCTIANVDSPEVPIKKVYTEERKINPHQTFIQIKIKKLLNN